MTTATAAAATVLSAPPLAQGLTAEDLHFAYRGRPVLKGASLTLAPGEVLSLLGANGAGKSTLLRLLLGFEKPKAGQVFLDGLALGSLSPREAAQRVAYVPQVHVTPFPYTVRDIALLGCMPARGLFAGTGPEDDSLVMGVLERLGIAHLAARPYTEVSGGERQLTLIARALVQGARILIMDEPVTGLDYGHQMRLLARLRELAEDGYAILKTTHHPEHALLASTRVALLVDGRIADEGRPAEVVTPAAISRLYGVEVAAFHSPAGHTAFHPVSGKN